MFSREQQSRMDRTSVALPRASVTVGRPKAGTTNRLTEKVSLPRTLALCTP